MEQDVFLARVTNLMLAPGTRVFEREQLRQAKHLVEAGRPVAESWAQLESSLRPLAMRDNLTPDVADFYRAETGDPAGAVPTDLSAHFDRECRFRSGPFLLAVVSGVWLNHSSICLVSPQSLRGTLAGIAHIPLMNK